MNNLDRRLTKLEEATAMPTMPYSQARERAVQFYTDLHKVYGQGTQPDESSIAEMTQHLMAGTYEQWVSDQVHAAYAELEREHAQQS